jgi:hypothetical protein
MITEAFVLCDGANDSHGKLNILGAFDTIVSQEFPFVHPHCTMALRLRYDHSDGIESRVKIDIKDQSGDDSLACIDTVIKHLASSTPSSTTNLIINLNALRFVKPGDYAVILQVNDIPAAITPLFIRQAQPDSVH